MLEQRVEERRIFLQQLAQAGWDVESWDAARDTGATVDLDAEAEYVGPTLALRLELLAEQHYVAFGICQLDGELVLRLRLYSKANLASVLAQIIAVQDTLNSDNHSQLVKLLIAQCDQLQIETDEGIFNLS
jgi:N-acetylglutamate synthase-like GNAT family acetyltransferase